MERPIIQHWCETNPPEIAEIRGQTPKTPPWIRHCKIHFSLGPRNEFHLIQCIKGLRRNIDRVIYFEYHLLCY
ncbi:unnamed protein product [Acanthoscelides obtectus]|uniref:Uncharacterized protein n=1 Tax=Acanthoscelides obtectus TaxID=200917 RepID=A0A9P0QEL2_ACAOB|nr:unnamed protein product [Acanthoscelides obtectus]CAK1689399.1 hypothetical protein AOBTE_LOCUS37225 [Acanthoscelides obtectus]